MSFCVLRLNLFCFKVLVVLSHKRFSLFGSNIPCVEVVAGKTDVELGHCPGTGPFYCWHSHQLQDPSLKAAQPPLQSGRLQQKHKLIQGEVALLKELSSSYILYQLSKYFPQRSLSITWNARIGQKWGNM